MARKCGRAGLSKIKRVSENNLRLRVRLKSLKRISIRNAAVAGEGIHRIGSKGSSFTCAGFGRSNDVEIAPIDSQVITRLLQHGLLLGTGAQNLEAARVVSAPNNGLFAPIYGNLGTGIEIDGYLMSSPVDR